MADNSTTLKRKVNTEEDRSDKLRKLARLGNKNAIKVTFGEPHSRFCIVHREIICKHSAFFREQCTKTIPPGTERVVPLTKIRRRHFQVYLDWVHLGEISLKAPEENAIDGMFRRSDGCNSNEKAHTKLHVLVTLWIMGAELQDPTFQDVVMRCIFNATPAQRRDAAACKALRDNVFKSCATDSTLHRLFLDLLERRLAEFGIEDAEMETWDKKVLIEMLQRRSRKTQGNVPVPQAQDYIRDE